MDEAGYDMECSSATKVLSAKAEGWYEWKVDQLLPTLRRQIFVKTLWGEICKAREKFTNKVLWIWKMKMV